MEQPPDKGHPERRDVTERVKLTQDKLNRGRRYRSPEEQPVFDADGKPAKFHDLLVIAPKGVHADDELFRVPVIKPNNAKGETPGTYQDVPERLDLYDYAQRKTLALARPQDWATRGAEGSSRGPAFATLPVKREPAATNCVTCYLLDAQNFTHRNAWTAEEWNDIGLEDLPPAQSADDPEFEVLIAGPRGKVFYLKVVLEEEGEDVWPPGTTQAVGNKGFIESLDLRNESEIWTQLRNGSVAGRVLALRKAIKEGKTLKTVAPIPLVNLTSLLPEE